MLDDFNQDINSFFSLHGKCALVTGASRGIGYAIAGLLAHYGATVIGTATTMAGVERIQALLANIHHTDFNEKYGMGILLDVTDSENISQVFASIEERYGAPLILVNNAGIVRDQLCLRMKEEDWNAVIQANLTGAFSVTRRALKGMLKARWGRVVNVGSASAALGNAGQVNYSAAKAGLEGFSRALAREVASRGITVNVIAPGFIETDITRQFSEEQLAQILSSVPLGRMGKPLEVALLVHFLVSEAAGYITGATLPINGGIVMG